MFAFLHCTCRPSYLKIISGHLVLIIHLHKNYHNSWVNDFRDSGRTTILYSTTLHQPLEISSSSKKVSSKYRLHTNWTKYCIALGDFWPSRLKINRGHLLPMIKTYRRKLPVSKRGFSKYWAHKYCVRRTVLHSLTFDLKINRYHLLPMTIPCMKYYHYERKGYQKYWSCTE